MGAMWESSWHHSGGVRARQPVKLQASSPRRRADLSAQPHLHPQDRLLRIPGNRHLSHPDVARGHASNWLRAPAGATDSTTSLSSGRQALAPRARALIPEGALLLDLAAGCQHR